MFSPGWRKTLELKKTSKNQSLVGTGTGFEQNCFPQTITETYLEQSKEINQTWTEQKNVCVIFCCSWQSFIYKRETGEWDLL